MTIYMTFGPDLKQDIEAHLQEEERRAKEERQRTADIERWEQTILNDLPTFREPVQEAGYCDDEKLERLRLAYINNDNAELGRTIREILDEAVQDAAERMVD